MRRTWTTRTFLVRVVQTSSLNASSSQAHGPPSTALLIGHQSRKRKMSTVVNLVANHSVQNNRPTGTKHFEEPAQGEPAPTTSALRSRSNGDHGANGSRPLAQGERTTAASAQPLAQSDQAQGEPAQGEPAPTTPASPASLEQARRHGKLCPLATAQCMARRQASSNKTGRHTMNGTLTG